MSLSSTDIIYFRLLSTSVTFYLQIKHGHVLANICVYMSTIERQHSMVNLKIMDQKAFPTNNPIHNYLTI